MVNTIWLGATNGGAKVDHMPRIREHVTGDAQTDLPATAERKLQSRFKLMQIRGVSSLVDTFEHLSGESTESSLEIACRRQRVRAVFFKIVGVEIELHEILKDRLETAAATGGESVAEIIADIRSTYRKKWTSVSGDFVSESGSGV